MVLGGFLFAGDPLAGAVRPLAALLLLAVAAELVRHFRGRASELLTPTWPVLALGAVFLVRALGPLLAPGSDTFGAKFAAGTAALGLGGLWLGFHAAARGEALFRRLLPTLSLAVGLFLLSSRLSGGSGLLGNTGYDLQVVLPGAVVGLLLWIRDPRAKLGLGAFVVTLAFAAVAPVVGGVLVLVAFAALGLAMAWRDPVRRPSGLRRAAVALALALPVALWLLVPASAPPSEPGATAGTQADELAGAGVRWLVWDSLIRADSRPRAAFGTGQFQAAYPPFRDPAEIALTTGGHTIEAVTEVEHPHNDWVLVLAENGKLTAALLALGLLGFFLLGLRRILTPLGEPALAAGALTLLVAGAFHAPLFANPISALFAGLLLGALGSASSTRGARVASAKRVVYVGSSALVLGTLALATAWSPVPLDPKRPELVSVDRARSAVEAGRLPFEWLAVSARGATDPAQRTTWWRLALEVHPHSLEAWMDLGLTAVRTGDLDAARVAWHTARELDPAYPVVLRNLERLGADLVLAGHLEAGLAELEPLVGGSPTPSGLESQAARTSPPFDRALRTAAAWLHGRELFAAGSTSGALFELRRAAVLAGHGERPPAVLGVELAVLASLQGDVQGARARLAELLDRGDREATTERLLGELPDPLQNAARILVRGIAWD